MTTFICIKRNKMQPVPGLDEQALTKSITEEPLHPLLK